MAKRTPIRHLGA